MRQGGDARDLRRAGEREGGVVGGVGGGGDGGEAVEEDG